MRADRCPFTVSDIHPPGHHAGCPRCPRYARFTGVRSLCPCPCRRAQGPGDAVSPTSRLPPSPPLPSPPQRDSLPPHPPLPPTPKSASPSLISYTIMVDYCPICGKPVYFGK
ncbi:hypothetical protein CRUP_024473 [Coryphaenoides rupestris]|nr:hypothetical protein CRUP_024473 [Coryphaenoides rupestris]